MQEKILITGASGFVGGFLVDEALKRGLDVYAAIRKTSNREFLQDPRIKFVFINFDDQKNLDEICKQHNFNYVVHNAGLTKSPSPNQYFKVNSDYLKNLVKAISRTNATLKKFTFVSSLAAFGPAEHSGHEIVSNETSPHPVTNYGRSKLMAENYLKEQEIPTVIIRPTAVYGPREWDLFTVYDLINKGLEMTVGLKDQKLTFIYVKDLVRVIMDATLSEKINVAYFATDLQIYTSTTYNEAIKKALGKKTLKIRLPISLVRIIAFASENIGKLTGKYPALNIEKVNELEAKSWVCDSQPLVDDLDFKPEYNLERGLSESIEWYRSRNLLK